MRSRTKAVGAVLVDQTGDDRVQADRLAGSGGAGDEGVGHLRQVGDVGSPREVLAQRQGKGCAGAGERRGAEDLAEAHHLRLRVGDLDADGALAGDRRHDPHAAGLRRQSQVGVQAGDPVHLDAGCGDDFELRDGRTGRPPADRGPDVEGGEGLHQHLSQVVELPLHAQAIPVFRRGKKLQARPGLAGDGGRVFLLGDGGGRGLLGGRRLVGGRCRSSRSCRGSRRTRAVGRQQLSGLRHVLPPPADRRALRPPMEGPRGQRQAPQVLPPDRPLPVPAGPLPPEPPRRRWQQPSSLPPPAGVALGSPPRPRPQRQRRSEPPARSLWRL